ncbi:restriction endonuclease subunit S [Ruminococcus sp. BSD2780120874_150323_B10]|uniref:restriction endonuclease subunit S n=1 Tax=Ruminococcus sp. BSD2780120874_150323_B10 TaxID=2787127 RepID=UPI00189A0CA2|nr:restriction endonuclease subunit S [Ruminococcus sp. BSD2780120874_150323_B10]
MVICLENVLEYEQPTKYIVKSENYSDDFALPVLTAGKSFVLGFTDETDGICKASENPVIIFDDFTADCKYVDFDFKVKSSAIKILHKANAEDNLKYYFYAMQAIDYTPFSHKRVWISEYSKFKIKNRSVAEQNNIVKKLDTVATAIDNAKQRLNALDELVKSRFIEMFGDPQNNNKQFPTKKLIDVVTLQRGHDLPVQNRDSHGSVPVYGSNGVLGFHTIAKCDRGIITGRSGTIGEVYVSEEPFWPLNTTLYSNNTHGNNLIYLKYLLMFFNLKRFKSGAGVPTLNRNEFHGKEIMDVPIELQNEFADFVKLIDK